MQMRERSSLPSLRMMAATGLSMSVINGGLPATAHAQTPPTSGGDPGQVQLPTVSVDGAQTGQGGYQVSLPALGKLTQPLVSTPQSVIEIPRQLLDDQGVTTMRDALRNVPGVSLAAGEGGQQGDNLSIRGFNAQNDFYLDGMRDFGSYYRDPFNLQDIEVLEGPSSILFGRGSSGGTINQVSKQAQLAPVTTGSVSLGTDGTTRFTSDVNRAIDGLPGSAVRLNVMANINGVAGRPAAESRRFGFAPEMAFGLGTATRVTLDYYHLQSYDTPDYGIPWVNGAPAPVARGNFYGFKDDDYFRTNVDIGTAKVEHDFTDWFTLSAQTRYASYERSLRVTEPLITGYQPKGVTGNDVIRAGIPLSAINISRNEIALTSRETTFDNQINGNLNFDIGPLKHAAVFGIEYARQTSDPTRYTYPTTQTSLLFPAIDPAFTSTGVVRSIAGSQVNNYGVYGVDTISIGPHLDLVGGFRWDRYESAFHQFVSVPAVRVTRDDDLPSYSAAVVVKPTPSSSLYVHYGTSFDPSAESVSLSVATASVAPEKTITYEVGGKWDLPATRLSLTGSIYQIEKRNARETDPNNPTLDVLAGDYRVRGFQMGATGHITSSWEVFGGYSYNDAVVVASPNPLELGNQPPNAPHHTVSAFTTYRLPWGLVPGHGIELGVGVNYVSARTASSTPVAGSNIIERAPGYWTMRLMAQAPLTDTVSLQANVTNVTDRYYYDSLHPGHIIIGPGRAALFTLNAKL
jgi:catecholate siderophore receptor